MQFIKDFIRSSYCPEFVSDFFYMQIAEKKKKHLLKTLAAADDLLATLQPAERAHWSGRIDKVCSAKENQFIPRDQQAGKIVEGSLAMHNGIKIDPLSYYKLPMLKMLMDNKGVHEPEEEYYFQETLKKIDHNKKHVILELGAYWSFYSMWFKSVFADAQCYMVEPSKENLYYGKRNFALNNMKGNFTCAGIGSAQDTSKTLINVDDFCKRKKIDHLSILHSDIQGYEYQMLEGAKSMVEDQKIDYIFISTHSNELHYQCKSWLESYGYLVLHDLDLTSSWDGILVFKSTKA